MGLPFWCLVTLAGVLVTIASWLGGFLICEFAVFSVGFGLYSLFWVGIYDFVFGL